MLETFLIGGLSAVIPLLLFWTIGGKNTLYVFIGVCVLGLLVGIFEDIDFSSSDTERNKNTKLLLQNYNNSSCDINKTIVYSFEGTTASALPECAYLKGTILSNRKVVTKDAKYSIPVDPVERCYFWYEFKRKYGYTEDPSIKYKEGEIIEKIINGKKRKWSMPKLESERCILYAAIENETYGINPDR